MARLGLSGRLREEMLVLDWPRVVGRDIARHARAVRLRQGVLHVQVRSPAWAAQLGFLEPELIRRLNERAGGPAVSDIRWEAGAWRSRSRVRLVRRATGRMRAWRPSRSAQRFSDHEDEPL